MRIPRLIVLAVLGLLALGTLATAGDASSATPKSPLPYVRGDQTVPTYSYAKAIHQVVYVQSPLDSDDSGRPDRIVLDIIRPREAAAAGVKVPVIMDASPYLSCCGRGNQLQKATYNRNGTIASMPLYYDTYFVPRGYAVAEVELTGTDRSTGCSDVGGRAEIDGARAAIQWLNGRANGYDQHGRRVTAAAWTTGAVGMIGKSWDGTIADGVAATGVKGLRTIVPISAITSWYDYMRFGGVLRYSDFTSYLDEAVSGRPAKTCKAIFAAQQKASDDATGDYNAFWSKRNYGLDASKVRASVFLVHGLNDLNVTTNQFGQWWPRLAADHVARKIWLSQDGHVDPFDYRRSVWVATLHHWFDHWLQGLHNGIMKRSQATIQRADGTWYQASSWPAATRSTTVSLATLGGSAKRTFTDNPNLQEATAVADPTTTVAGRAAFVSGPLTESVRVSGAPSVTLRVKLDKPTSELSARLVDYGRQRRIDYLSPGEGVSTEKTMSCWGESTKIDSACYYNVRQDFITSDTDIITRGWLDAAHHVSLSKVTPLTPGRWYSITIPLDTTDATFAAGHRLGLVITASDEQYTDPRSTGATVTIDPARSVLSLPTAGRATIAAGAGH